MLCSCTLCWSLWYDQSCRRFPWEHVVLVPNFTQCGIWSIVSVLENRSTNLNHCLLVVFCKARCQFYPTLVRCQFHPTLVTDVCWFADVLIRFWGQKVKGHGDNRQWPKNCANTISHKPVKGILLNFGHTCMWVNRCDDYLLGSNVKVLGHGRQTTPYRTNQSRQFYPILVTDILGFAVLIRFWGQRSRSQQVMTQNRVNTISS